MPAGKKQDRKRNSNEGANDKLKWETARELSLDDNLSNPGEELTVREAGKIGGNMVRKLVKAGQESLKDALTQTEETKS
jgi:hypothetical protein